MIKILTLNFIINTISFSYCYASNTTLTPDDIEMNPNSLTTRSVRSHQHPTDIQGPFLFFKSQKKRSQKITLKKNNSIIYWNVDALVIADESTGKNLSLNIDSTPPLKPKILHTEHFKNTKKGFFIFHIKALQEKRDYLLEYTLNYNNKQIIKKEMHIPGYSDSLCFITTPCNIFYDSENEKHIHPQKDMWESVKKHREINPIHLVIGLGGQIYCDQILKIPSLKPWLDIKNNITAFTQYSPSQEQRHEIDAYFLDYYLNFYGNNNDYISCLSNTPQMNLWSDHGLFYGFGSYPEKLQNSPMFQAIENSARKYYLLFQQGSSAHIPYSSKSSRKYGFLTNKNYSFFKTIGSTLFLGLDTCGERSEKKMITTPSWKILLDQLEKISSNKNRLVLLSTTPFIYPITEEKKYLDFFCNPYRSDNPISQKIRQWLGSKLRKLDDFGCFLPKINKLNASWNEYKEDKRILLSLMNEWEMIETPITILTTDPHCAGISCIEDLNSTPNFFQKNRIYQLMTSPLETTPTNQSSQKILKMMESNVKTRAIDSQKKERFIKWEKKPKKPYFMQEHNWIESIIEPDGQFRIRFFTEKKENDKTIFESVNAHI